MSGEVDDLAERIAEVLEPHEFMEAMGGYIECSCGWPWPITDRWEHPALHVVGPLIVAAQADAWDACAQEANDLGWAHDYGRYDLVTRNPYRAHGDL